MAQSICEYIALIYDTEEHKDMKGLHQRRIQKVAEGLGKLLEYYDDPRNIPLVDCEWQKTADGYYKKKIFQNNCIEIIMLKWPKNAITPVHDHPNTGCWFAIVSGEIEEYTGRDGGQARSKGTVIKKMGKWHISYREGESSVHQLKAITDNTFTISINTFPGYYDNLEVGMGAH
jgi:hypothetical protein